MAMFCFVGFATIAVVSAFDCNTDSFSACAPPNTFPLDFPETGKQLDRSCSIVADYMRCVRDKETKCHGGFEYEEPFNRVFGTLRDICDRGSKLHQRLRKDISCIKKQLNRQNETYCLIIKEKVTKAFESLVLYNKEFYETDITDEQTGMLICLHHALDISCFLQNVDACGVEAKEASMQIIRQSGFVQDGCPAETLLNVTDALPRLQLGLELEHGIRNVLGLGDTGAGPLL